MLKKDIQALELKLVNKTEKIEFIDVNDNNKPLHTIDNFRLVLEKNNINIAYNEISKDLDFNVFEKYSNNEKITLLLDICVKERLNLNTDKVMNFLKVVGRENTYNPFIKLLELNKNNDETIIKKVFDTLEINYGDEVFIDDLKEYYFEIFYRWCLNLVQLSMNTLVKGFQSEGLLTIQGKQGCYKSTWASKLMPNKTLFKGGQKLDPKNKDSIIENTRYLLVELAELDSTLKAEQSTLKQFITRTSDLYRAPYDRVAQIYPRNTTFIATVNSDKFLKDKTGNRRYFIIPVIKCDIDKLTEIDMLVFWGKIYNDLLSGETCYLNDKFRQIQEIQNKKYLVESDISLSIDESLDFEVLPEEYAVYTIKEICENLNISTTGNTKKIKDELVKRGYEHKTHRLKAGKLKKGFLMPPFKQ